MAETIMYPVFVGFFTLYRSRYEHAKGSFPLETSVEFCVYCDKHLSTRPEVVSTIHRTRDTDTLTVAICPECMRVQDSIIGQGSPLNAMDLPRLRDEIRRRRRIRNEDI